MLRLNTRLFAAVALVVIACSAPAFGQFDSGESGLDFQKEFGNLGGDLFNAPKTDNPLELESFIVPATKKEPALVVIRAKMPTGWHVYSLTQKPGGTAERVISLQEPKQTADGAQQFELLDGFRPEEKPEISTKEDAWGDLPIEEHYGQVTWVAPIKFAQGVDPAKVTIKGELKDGQVCHDKEGCLQFGFALQPKFTAKIATDEQIVSVRPEPPAVAGEYEDVGSDVVIRGHIEPEVVAPGGTAKLKLTIETKDGWHVYQRHDEIIKAYSPTIIPLATTSGLHPRTPKADTEIISREELRYQDGTTTWTIDFPIPETAEGEYKISGYLGYLTCSDSSCKTPSAVKFRGVIEVGKETVTGNVPLGFDDASYGQAKQALATRVAWSDPERAEAINYAELPLMIVFSLLGGLILNLMPCVLPVIGLKILSFAEQAGQSRAKVFALNLSYSLGLMSVFIALATMAVVLNLGWGEQFTSTWFNVAMCALVFAMALSFLGVWEIPIPGFVGGETAGKLETKEGLSGAFFKGILTTILATPCSGPFLGPVFGFTLKQPSVVTFIIFGAIGLGMSLPYLIIGAFPALVRFIPKPGAWMVTFKQIMGFFLLGTVVFLFSFMNKDYLVATFAMLIGIWLACWWIGRTPLTASTGKRATAWIGGALSAAMIGFIAFQTLAPQPTKIPWQPYSQAALQKAQSEGKTVMVDYTADWCWTCKTNLKFAINTDEVHKTVEANGVVPLLADWTQPNEEIKQSLQELESKSIPVLAIYPANRPGEVIVLRDLISQSQVLDALEKAGPSAGEVEDGSERTAMKR